ncbi:MAG: hypothetical protein J6M66_06195 [Lachnospiraceae bacterium]|nr:hypothetical protein [Lachnospiraceae bacterium]
MKKVVNLLRKMIKKIIFRIKLIHMDSRWRFYGGSSYDLFPPSFYYTHTEEEIKRITAKELAALHQMIEEFQKQDHRK